MGIYEAMRRVDEIDVAIKAHEASIEELRKQRAGYYRTIERITAQVEPVELCAICHSPKNAPIHAGEKRGHYWHHDFAYPPSDFGLMPGRRES